MTETITVAEYKALLKIEKPRTTPKKKQDSELVQYFNAVLIPYHWRCGEVRMPCDHDPRKPDTKRKSATMNALVMWYEEAGYCPQRVRFVGWLWEVEGWSDAQVRALVVREVSE